MTTAINEHSTGIAPTQWSLSCSGTDCPLSAFDVLRMFDRLRRQVARDRHGSEGLFLGYDVLDLALDDAEEWFELRASAHVTAACGRRDTVFYLADVVDGRAGRTHVIATATGVTAT